MRWFVFSLFLVCFSAQAQVVCKDPNSVGGDETTQASNVNSACRTNVTDAPQGSVDRVGDEEGSRSPEAHKKILTSTATDENGVNKKTDTSSDKKGTIQ